MPFQLASEVAADESANERETFKMLDDLVRDGNGQRMPSIFLWEGNMSAASLIERARQPAGLIQAEVAQRAAQVPEDALRQRTQTKITGS